MAEGVFAQIHLIYFTCTSGKEPREKVWKEEARFRKKQNKTWKLTDLLSVTKKQICFLAEQWCIPLSSEVGISEFPAGYVIRTARVRLEFYVQNLSLQFNMTAPLSKRCALHLVAAWFALVSLKKCFCAHRCKLSCSVMIHGLG